MQLGSAVGQPAEYEGTRQPDLPCLVVYMHISNISAIRRMLTMQGGCRDTGARRHKQPVGRLQLIVVYGLPASTPNKLQLIQNHAAHLRTVIRTLS